MSITDYEEYPTTISTVLQELNVVSDLHVTSGLKQKSTWIPRQAMDNSVDVFFKLVWQDLDEEEVKWKQPIRHNLKFEEYLALKSLQSDDDVIIKRADKGGNIVVMNREDYEKRYIHSFMILIVMKEYCIIR
ncbi:hypothetical protein NDU88_003394 [Pleurodeles waltl]|uniref:Uncharacterized protein n=1 Tax=Pleurodeles waltl TaxID=8319 RepID=A0AAV7RH95_PLEWA|nr:hypothetical protein NDU88_003394 [Pleurodeles waltl]